MNKGLQYLRLTRVKISSKIVDEKNGCEFDSIFKRSDYPETSIKKSLDYVPFSWVFSSWVLTKKTTVFPHIVSAETILF